jgi:hypothetical protein
VITNEVRADIPPRDATNVPVPPRPANANPVTTDALLQLTPYHVLHTVAAGTAGTPPLLHVHGAFVPITATFFVASAGNPR